MKKNVAGSSSSSATPPASIADGPYNMWQQQDDLAQFVEKVDSSVDIIASSKAVLMLDRWKAFDHLISQKLYKNIHVRLLCPFDETIRYAIKRITPFFDYKKAELASILKIDQVLLIRDSAAEVIVVDFEQFNRDKDNNDSNSHGSGSADERQQQLYSPLISRLDRGRNPSLVKVIQSSFDSLWNQTENNEKLQEEKRHSDLLLDVLTHDLGNHSQIVEANLELAYFSLKRLLLDEEDAKETNNNRRSDMLTVIKEDIMSILEEIEAAQRAARRSASIADNVRKVERMHKQKKVELVPYDLVPVIQNAASTVQKAFEGDKKKIAVNVSKQIIVAQDNDSIIPSDSNAPSVYSSTPLLPSVSPSMTSSGNNNNSDSSRITIAADELVEEIFVNLFSNSAKYTDSEYVRIDIDIFENYLGEKKYWMINVSDYGRGIPDAVKQELFQRFYLRAKGSGLGLAIVKALVERYGGKVWVADRVYGYYSKGVTFGILFPALL